MEQDRTGPRRNLNTSALHVLYMYVQYLRIESTVARGKDRLQRIDVRVCTNGGGTYSMVRSSSCSISFFRWFDGPKKNAAHSPSLELECTVLTHGRLLMVRVGSRELLSTNCK